MTNLSGSAGSRKRSSSFSSASLSRTCCFHSGGSPCARGHDDGAGLRADQLVHHGLVEHAAFAVEDHHLALKPFGSTLVWKCLTMWFTTARTRSGFLTSTAILAARLARSSRSCSLRFAGDLLVGFVDGGLVDLQLHLRRLEMQRQRGLVADGFLERVAAHVALLVLVRAEGPEGVPVGAVDGRAGEAEQERIRQRLAHLAAEVAFLRAMRLVHHHDDVRALVQLAAGLAELVDGGDEHLAHILRRAASATPAASPRRPCSARRRH